MLISAVLCTRNREHYLKKALESLIRQTLPQTQYNIIVVDNGSTDQTREMVAKYKSHTRNLHYLYEPKIGLSQARNTGWRYSQATYVAFLDDDAIADNRWLEKILDVFHSVEPVPGCVGGVVEPMWEGERPEWLPDELLCHLTVLNWGATAFSVQDPKNYIAPTNMAFPRSLLHDLNGFTTRLGRRGANFLSMEEVDLIRRIRERGMPVYYAPEVLVRHWILNERLCKKWFYQRSFWQGAIEAYMRIQKDQLNFSDRLWIGGKTFMGLLVKPAFWKFFFRDSSIPSEILRKCGLYARFGHALSLWEILKI